MEFKAFKMDGLGNDFVIIDNRSNNVELTRDQIIRICDRKFIGCDQLIFVKKSNKGDAEMEFYNSDGSISGACGNGTRCVAFLIFKETDKKVVDLFVGSNHLKSKILENSEVETIIGVPKTNWKDIPISENLDTKNLGIEISDKNNSSSKGGIAVNVGNPHVIFFVDNIELVCFTTNLAINSWPVVIPPRTPPLLFERNKGFLFFILISSTLEIPVS